MNKYKNVVTKLESKSLEEIIIFLRSYSSKLGKKEEHCRDLMDKEKI
ncbi:hypothetical protein H3N56_02365 [Cetobacterium sp. 2A]|nr:hypothetical protein [Cetobacterium sp. 2A]MBC2855336.1 hypothetical protein [Cetobacterium sp. 2A]